MKTKLVNSAVSFLAFSVCVIAAPLTVTTAVHTKPDANSPAISYLKAGTEPVAALSAFASAPAGWMAVELAGPFEGYVENKDLTKSLDVKPGANIRVAPKLDAGVLAVAEKDDKTTITGLRGKWTQITLEKKLVGFINVSAGGSQMSPKAATTPAPSTAVVPPPPT